MEPIRNVYTFIWNVDSVEKNLDSICDFDSSVLPSSIMGVCHGDHWHILYFTSTKNASRKSANVISFLNKHVKASEEDAITYSTQCVITRQYVRNPMSFIRYLIAKFNGKVFADKNDSNTLYLLNIFNSLVAQKENMLSDEALGDCTNPSTLRRASMNEHFEMAAKTKHDKNVNLFNLFKDLDVKSEEDFNEWIKSNGIELPELWTKYGQNWRTKLRDYIEVFVKTKRSKFDEPFYSKSYIEKVLTTECSDPRHDPLPEEGANYLEEIFVRNHINVRNFFKHVDEIIRMVHPRKNGLVLRGPTTTGKSLIAKNIVKAYNYGSVSRDGDATAFYFQNLLDHDVALMEEPHISMTTVQNFKELLAGSPFVVQVKNKPPRNLGRIPCIVTTNQALWDNLTDVEAEPIKKRIFEYFFYEPIVNDYFPIICFHSWKCLCQRYK